MPHLIKMNKISNNKNLITTNHLCPIKKEKCYKTRSLPFPPKC